MDTLTQTQLLIEQECDNIKALLLDKNRKYGDSAVNPLRVFSQSSPMEQILVRMDDKVNRWKNRQDDDDEDIILDLMGYLILYRVANTIHGENNAISSE